VEVSEPAATKPGKRLKAPTGTLENAILSLKPQGMTNGEVRTALQAQGYQYSLKPEMVRQRLVKLTKGKSAQLVAEKKGGEVRYSLKKK
jgi:hypothetical protein